jgi:hypothetical protein
VTGTRTYNRGAAGCAPGASDALPGSGRYSACRTDRRSVGLFGPAGDRWCSRSARAWGTPRWRWRPRPGPRLPGRRGAHRGRGQPAGAAGIVRTGQCPGGARLTRWRWCATALAPASLDRDPCVLPRPRGPKARHPEAALIQPAHVRPAHRPAGARWAAALRDRRGRLRRADAGVRSGRGRAEPNVHTRSRPRPAHRPDTRYEERGRAAGRASFDLLFRKSNVTPRNRSLPHDSARTPMSLAHPAAGGGRERPAPDEVYEAFATGRRPRGCACIRIRRRR